ncbi:hypothetical protein GCM10010136_30810 [Limoniibacter endophyticus]|uniref:Tripartite-type tricarboxylate transporter receptor subunit TctC n=2 Tax=Limoniibacter endophyticus TaxID=1565040 RepID=A0A8J3DKZ4_9HYPH|nr:hypothetical protein GCM10010136_30810 [Limoniibacter endophyticus]
MKLGLGLALSAAVFASPLQAQEYPAKEITVVVPFSAGGPTDTVARLVAQIMSEDLGKQVLVQNVGGAGGTLGAGQVAKASNDGYTLLLHHIGMATAPSLYKNLTFDSLEDFAPIGQITKVPMTIVARKDFEPADAAALWEHIKAEGENVTYAQAGIGSASHLCGTLLMNALGVKMTEVPYQGAGPAMTDIIGGQIDMICDQTTNTTNQIKAGEVKAYAVTTPERLEALPDLPTTKEAGLENVNVTVWHGLYAPAGTDPAIVARLQESLKKALQNETVVQRFADLGTAPVPQEDVSPESLQALVQEQIGVWKPILEPLAK